MESREEKYQFYKRMGEELEAMKERAEAFHLRLSQELFDLVFAYWPEMEVCREQLSEPLRELTEKYSNHTMECLNSAEYYLYNDEPIPDIRPVSRPLSLKNAENQVEEFIREIPEADPELVREIVMEDFDVEMRNDHFVHRVHHKMKEALTLFYSENILKLEADHLLLLDDCLYIVGAGLFVEDYHELADKIKEENNQT